jgi:hypothetical protein
MRGSSVKVPWSQPVADPEAKRVPARTYKLAGGGSGPSVLAPFHAPFVTGPMISGGLPIDADTTIELLRVTMTDTDDVEIDVLVNGASVDSVSLSASAYATYVVSIDVVEDDVVSIEVTDAGTGVATDLVILPCVAA